MMTFKWCQEGTGRLTGIAWPERLAQDKPIDPYLVWADLAGPAGFAAPESGSDAVASWPFIVQLSESGLPAEYFGTPADNDVPEIFQLMDIPGVYKRIEPLETQNLGGSPSPAAPANRSVVYTAYVTAHIAPGNVHKVLDSREVVRAQLGLPRMQAKISPAVELRSMPASGQKKPRVVIGIIDDGFGFAHPRLLDAQGRPRVHYLWDQHAQRGHYAGTNGWTETDHLGYGAELKPRDLREIVAGAGNDPWAPYRAADYGRYRLDPKTLSTLPLDADGRRLPVATLLAHTHGHAVTDLAAGYPPTHLGQVQPLPQARLAGPRDQDPASQEVMQAVDSQLGTNAVEGENLPLLLDSADQWPLICVQLPTRTVADTSGGSLAVHVLDGIHYIVDRARRIPFFGGGSEEEGKPSHKNNRVVINVSYGATGGGHDGSSILEQAITGLVDESDMAVWVVLAAGNAHRSSAHASMEIEPGESNSFTWTVGPDNPLESYLELWLPDEDALGEKLAESAASHVQVHLRPPFGPTLQNLRAGQIWQLCEDHVGSAPVAAVVFAHRVVQSKHGTMILMAIAPTRNSDPAAAQRTVGPHGEWVVTVERHAVIAGATTAPGRLCVHAWAERNDLVFGSPRPQQGRVYCDDNVGPRSEFQPAAIAAWNSLLIAANQRRTAQDVRPEPALSSLASMREARANFALAPTGRGEVVVSGGLRLADNEVASMSSGGPGRLMPLAEELGRLKARHPSQAMAQVRAGPDVSAPSELSAAVPGLRAAGFHSAIHTRISATSAAAALVTRAIANVQYVATQSSPTSRGEKSQTAESNLFISVQAVPKDDDRLRSSLTPRADDAFRGGRVQLR